MVLYSTLSLCSISNSFITQLNKIYNQGKKICKIVRGLYKSDKAKQDLFSFSKTVAAITGGVEGAEKDEEMTPTPAK